MKKPNFVIRFEKSYIEGMITNVGDTTKVDILDAFARALTNNNLYVYGKCFATETDGKNANARAIFYSDGCNDGDAIFGTLPEIDDKNSFNEGTITAFSNHIPRVVVNMYGFEGRAIIACSDILLGVMKEVLGDKCHTTLHCLVKNDYGDLSNG